MSFDKITNTCHDLLFSFDGAKETLAYLKNRASEQSIKEFNLGYFPSNEHLEILISAVGKEILSDNDLLYDTRTYGEPQMHAKLENHNLIIPYQNVYGEIIGIAARSLLNDENRGDKITKYKNTGFKKGYNLFALFQAKETIIQNNMCYVVEGQFDCITAHDKGIKNVVALGCSSLTFEQFSLLNRYTNNIILLLDNDDAGIAGARRAVSSFGRFANVKMGKLPDGVKDMDELLNGGWGLEFSLVE
jgi:DNA primase